VFKGNPENANKPVGNSRRSSPEARSITPNPTQPTDVCKYAVPGTWRRRRIRRRLITLADGQTVPYLLVCTETCGDIVWAITAEGRTAALTEFLSVDNPSHRSAGCWCQTPPDCGGAGRTGTPCDAWAYDGGVVFRDLTPDAGMTLRGCALGYAAQEMTVVPSLGPRWQSFCAVQNSMSQAAVDCSRGPYQSYSLGRLGAVIRRAP